MSSNDVNGPYRPAGGRGADDNSGGARSAITGGSGERGGAGGGKHSAGRNGNGSRGYTRGNGNGNGNGAAGKYPDPEGWGDDGFWRDSSMDSDYETGLNSAVRTNGNGPRGNGGYSFWADGKGWENSPGNGAQQGNGAAPAKGFGRRNRNGGGNHTRVDSFATRMDGYATRMDGYPTRSDQVSSGGFGPGGEPTAFYGGTAAPGLGTGGNGNGGGPAGYREGPGRGPWRPGRGTRGPGGPRVKVKGSWWRHWGWKKVLGLFGAFVAMIVLLLVGTYYYLYNSTQIPTQPVADIAWQNSTVYYSDGTTPIGTFGEIHRQVLQYDQIPQKVDDAVMAAEDRNFMTEGGISPTGILRAAYEDLFGNGGSLQGGSTITQQFVRNYYQDIGTEQTTSRKIKEIFVAMKLAKTKSKQWILQNYLNMIYLGTGAYGVGAAAETYFHVPIGKVTIAQAAVIAAIIQQPNNYPQPEFRSELVARWHYVLNGMVTMGDLTQQQADTMAFPKMYDSPEQSYGSDPWDPYVMNVVQNELEGVDHITVGKLDTGGYKIVTTISRSMETALYSAVNQNLKLMRQQGTPLPWYALIGAELQNPATGAIVAMYPGQGQNIKHCAKYDCDLNTAVYAREQVGSSFKPYVLAASVQAGMNVQTSVLNASPRLWVPPDSMPLKLSAYTAAQAVPESFPVHNDGYETIGGTKAGGATTVTNALAQSSNTAYTDLAHRVGTANIIKMAANMGVNIDSYKYGGSGLTDMLGQVGMALGTASLTVNEQATMLSTIDNKGIFHSAHIVASYQASGGPVVPGFVKVYQALPAGLDSQVQYAMSQTTVYGTGTAAAMTDGRPIIGKTGTTDNAESAFFIGAIPQWTLVVGIFTQQQNGISSETLNGIGGFGGIWPAAIWHTFAEMEFAKLPIENFQSPIFSGAKWVQVAPQPKKKKKPTKTVCTKFRFRCPPPGGGGHGHHGGGPTQTPTPNPTNSFPTGGPPTTPPPSGTPTPTGTGSPTGTPTPTGTATGQGGVPGHASPTASTVQAGIALGGILTVLPGSLLWTRASRRRRRRRRGAAR